MFLSAKSSVDSGAHSATESLHKIVWPADGKLGPSLEIVDVVSNLFIDPRVITYYYFTFFFTHSVPKEKY